MRAPASILRRGRRALCRGLLLVAPFLELGTAGAEAAIGGEDPVPYERLSPERGARYCHDRGLLCLGVPDVAAAGGMLAWVLDTERNRQRVMVRPLSGGALSGPPVAIAVERGVQRSDVLEVAATAAPGGGAIVAWDKWEQDDGGVGLPMLVRARRISLTGAPVGDASVLARIPRYGDEPGLEGDDVFSSVNVAASGEGVLAGWLTPGSRKRLGDRAGVVLPLDQHARPVRGARPRTVTDRGADDLTLAARPGGFVASWTRWRRVDRHGSKSGFELRVRLLDASGRPAAPAVTALQLPGEDAEWWATPVLAVRDGELLVAWARRAVPRAAGIELLTRRLTLEGRRAGPDALVARIAERATDSVILSAAPQAAGGWVLASATTNRSHPQRYESAPGVVHAVRLGEDGTKAAEPMLVSRHASPHGSSLAWDTAAPTLAWTASPSFWALPRLHVASLG